MIDRSAAMNAWKVLPACFCYLTLPFIGKMQHFYTYSTHPAVKSIDTMSISMKKFGVEKPCLYEMAAS